MWDNDTARAKSAYAAVDHIARAGSGKEKEYLAKAQALPMLIRASGLLPALVYYQAKERRIADALAEWVCERQAGLIPSPPAEKRARPTQYLVSHLLECDGSIYRWAAREAELWAVWLKRLAEGLLDDQHPAAGGTP